MATPLPQQLRFVGLRPGDLVRLLSPASYPDEGSVLASTSILTNWGLAVVVGKHALDQRGATWPGTTGTGYSDRGWTLLDVLADHFADLDIPVLGGLELGHGTDPLATLLGTPAHLDADAGTLIVQPAATFGADPGHNSRRGCA